VTTSTAITRRTRKRINPVDVAHFRPHIEQAIEAFQADVTYACLMARAAVTIVRKREVWQTRREAREAVAEV
jgi:predicted transcriptional regulator